MGYANLGISQLATPYYKVPVATTSGLDPTTLPVQFAFMGQATQVPQSGDWVNGSWETVTGNLIYPWAARCLIGPGGAITPGTGDYVAYIKIVCASAGSPEVWVEIVGILEIS